MTSSDREAEYEFALILDGITKVDSGVEDALFEAGCDDATISVRCGRVYLTFSRTASSVKDAVIGAIRDVAAANVGARVLRVDSRDLVTQSDIARRIDRSRQLVHQYITGVRGPGAFPPPACNITDGSPLWHWCEVAHWLCQNGIIKEDVLREAQEIAVINSVLDIDHQRQTEPQLTQEIMDALQC